MENDAQPDHNDAQPDHASVVGLMRYSPVADDLAERFAAAGHALYLVGGSVRDALLGRLSADLDFTTDARPEAITRIVSGWADAVWDTGIAFGTVGATRRGVTCELTTFRADEEPGPEGIPTTVGLTADETSFVLEPAAWAPVLQLAALAAKAGRVKESIVVLRKAVEHWPHVPAIGLALADLLRSKELTIKEIAERVGYREVRSYIRFFKRHNISFKKNSIRARTEARGRGPRPPALDARTRHV